jgi:hypothetical protein
MSFLSAAGAWLLKVLGPMILNWVIGGIRELIKGYMKRKENEKTNQEIKEGVLSAETDAERQAALDAAGRHIGRR